MATPTDDPDRRLHALAAEFRVVIGQLIRRLRAQTGPDDFTWSQKAVLSHLERDGAVTVTALARVEGVRPQSMGATVGVLEDVGLVRRESDPGDRRQTILSLTPAGRDLVLANRAAREDWLFHAIGRLSPQDEAQLQAVLPLFRRLLEP